MSTLSIHVQNSANVLDKALRHGDKNKEEINPSIFIWFCIKRP